jgi:chromate transporter
MLDPLTFFWLLLKASLFSSGGLSNLPILHDDLVGQGWASDRQFVEALAVGKVSPGPSGLWVISLGYLLDGLRGALLALVAISLPPLLVLLIHSASRRLGQHALVQGFVQGLSLAAVSILTVILGQMLWDTGLDVGSLLILLASLWLGTRRSVPYVLLIALAALAGIVLY